MWFTVLGWLRRLVYVRLVYKPARHVSETRCVLLSFDTLPVLFCAVTRWCKLHFCCEWNSEITNSDSSYYTRFVWSLYGASQECGRKKAFRSGAVVCSIRCRCAPVGKCDSTYVRLDTLDTFGNIVSLIWDQLFEIDFRKLFFTYMRSANWDKLQKILF
jgi:hypothetical protein